MDTLFLQNFSLAGFVVLLCLIAVCGWLAWDTRKKVMVLFDGKKLGKEDIVKDALRRIMQSEKEYEALQPRVKVLEELSNTSIQKIGFLRFNPFQDTGGDNSFVLVLLDREDNGVILSSLYMREGVRIYAKRVEGGKTKQRLLEEEKKTLDEAINKSGV